MANQEKYAQQMQDAGVCDARGAALCATVKELPDGSFGMVLLGVKGNDLLIYDTNMKSEPLKLMYTIPLKGVTDFSTTSLMGEILKGYTFRFTSARGRLPCYDFIPVTNHTLGASLLCRSGQRLRVQSAPMM